MHMWRSAAFFLLLITSIPLLTSGKLSADLGEDFECGDHIGDPSDIPPDGEVNCEILNEPHPYFCETYGPDGCGTVGACEESDDPFRCGGTPQQPVWCGAQKFTAVQVTGYCKPCDTILVSGGGHSEVECYGSGGDCNECECVICATGIAYLNAATCARDLPTDRKGFAYAFKHGCANPDT